MAGPIILCYDGSDGSREAIRVAGGLFPSRHAVVVHAWEPLAGHTGVAPVPGLGGAIRGGIEELDRIAEERSNKLAAEGAEAAAAAGLEAEPLSVEAPHREWRAIAAVADEREAAAVVLGARGRSGIESALLGSVSYAVVHHVRRPVLVVPPAAG